MTSMESAWPAAPPTRRLVAAVRLLAGLWLFAAGVALGLRSGLGVSPWDVFHDGIRHTTPLSFGAATILVGVVLVAATALAGVKHGPGTLTNMVAIGVFVDVLLATGVGRELDASSLILRVVAALAGVALVALGTALYVGAGLGAGPRDSLMLVIADRTRLDIGVVRALIEVGVLAVGIALGGAFGIGTILFALGIGPAVGFAFRLLRVTTQGNGTQAHDGLTREGTGDC